MVNREVIDALGPEGTLINIARGTIVDEEALVLALQEDRLGALHRMCSPTNHMA